MECRRPTTEVLLTSIIAGLLTECPSRLRNGSIIDAGARQGGHACYFAHVAPSRTVFAFEPMLFYYRKLVAHAKPYPNMRPLQCALGRDGPRWVDPQHESAIMLDGPRLEKLIMKHAAPPQPLVPEVASIGSLDSGGSSTVTEPKGGTPRPPWMQASAFRIERVDDIFASEPVAVAHFDVEGLELDVLQGAVATTQRDLPLLSVELHVASNATFTARLHTFLERDLAYSVYVVNEVCGKREDCRNLLAFPRAREHLLRGSSTLDLAIASGSLVRARSPEALIMLVPSAVGKSAPMKANALQRSTRFSPLGEHRPMWP